jgi:hypothetical protein
VPGANASSWSGCAGAVVITSSEGIGRDAAEQERMGRMDADLEHAIYDLAPEAYCAP